MRSVIRLVTYLHDNTILTHELMHALYLAGLRVAYVPMNAMSSIGDVLIGFGELSSCALAARGATPLADRKQPHQ